VDLRKNSRLQTIDLSLIPEKELGRAYGFCTLPLKRHTKVETAIHEATEEHSVVLRFQPDEITHFGLWMYHGGWSGRNSKPYFNLGHEPCIGHTDAKPQTKKHGEDALLPARKMRSWSLGLLVN
jgi:hypothetical protein